MSNSPHYSSDLEKSQDETSYAHDKNGGTEVTTSPVAVTDEEIVYEKGPIFRWFKKIFAMGVEARGIERVPEEERSDKHSLNLLLFWFSVNTVLTTVPIGMLAQAYYTLTFKMACTAIIVFNIIGTQLMVDSQPSHLPSDPTPSTSSSRTSSTNPHLRATSTDTTTPLQLSAALQLEKPPSLPASPTQKPSKKKFHIKTFQETIEENLAKAEASAGSSDPWISRKFAIGLVVGLIGWTSYVVIGRICIPMLDRTSRAGSRGRGIAFLVVFSVLLFFFVWSYTKNILTGPGFAKDYVPPFQIPTNPYHLQPPTFSSNPRPTSDPSSPPTPSFPASETHDHERPPSPGPTNPLPIAPSALPTSAALPLPSSNRNGGLCSSPPLLAQRKAEEGALEAQPVEREWVERFPPEPEVHGRWCGFCELVKPERTHHCRMCGTCVLNMDHHCPWIGTCVGTRNHKFFLVFLLYSTLFTIYTLVISAISLRGSDNDPMIISIIVLSVLFTAFTASMGWTHTYLILINMSTIETLRVASFRERESAALQRRHGFFPTSSKRANLARLHSHWGSPYKEGNPFWLGTRRNWTAVMGEETWKWFLPLGGPRDGKRGEAYERNERCGDRGEWRRREEWPEELK